MISIGIRSMNKQVKIQNKEYSLELFRLIIQHEHPNLEKERQLVDWCRQAITEVERSNQTDYGMDFIELIKQSNIKVSTQEISDLKTRHAYECMGDPLPQLRATIKLSSVNKLVLTTAINHIRSSYDITPDMVKLLYQKYNPDLSINIQAKPQIEILDQSDHYQRLPSISTLLGSFEEEAMTHSGLGIQNGPLNDVAASLLLLSQNQNTATRRQDVSENTRLPSIAFLLNDGADIGQPPRKKLAL